MSPCQITWMVEIRLKFLWPIKSSSSVTGTVRMGVQEILLISFMTGWSKIRKPLLGLLNNHPL